MPKTTHDLGLKTSIQNFDTFVRCTLMGNQPWPQFQNGIRERSIKQAAQFHTSTLRNSQLYMPNFAKLKKIIARHDLETKTKTFKAIDLKVKRI